MRKLYENFHIFHFQKSIVSAETIRGNTVRIQNSDKYILYAPGLESFYFCIYLLTSHSWSSHVSQHLIRCRFESWILEAICKKKKKKRIKQNRICTRNCVSQFLSKEKQKVSKSLFFFFLKLHCPKNEQNIRQNFALSSYGRILSNILLVFWAIQLQEEMLL